MCHFVIKTGVVNPRSCTVSAANEQRLYVFRTAICALAFNVLGVTQINFVLQHYSYVNAGRSSFVSYGGRHSTGEE